MDPDEKDTQTQPPANPWEPVYSEGADRTERLRIEGGWLYRSQTERGVALVFVVDFEDIA